MLYFMYLLIYLLVSVSVSHGKSADCTGKENCVQKFGTSSNCNTDEGRCTCLIDYRIDSESENCLFKQTASNEGESCLSGEECVSSRCSYIIHEVGICESTSSRSDADSRPGVVLPYTGYERPKTWLIVRIVGIIVSLLVVVAIIIFLICRRIRMRREQVVMYQQQPQYAAQTQLGQQAQPYPQNQQFPQQQPYPQNQQQPYQQNQQFQQQPYPQSQPQPYPQPADSQPPPYPYK